MRPPPPPDPRAEPSATARRVGTRVVANDFVTRTNDLRELALLLRRHPPPSSMRPSRSPRPDPTPALIPLLPTTPRIAPNSRLRLAGAPLPRARGASAVRASAASPASAKLQAGDKVRVTSSAVVYHVPKSKGAPTELKGMEGEAVASRADELDGTYISANLEIRVKLAVPDDPKGKTFGRAHEREDELEVL